MGLVSKRGCACLGLLFMLAGCSLDWDAPALDASHADSDAAVPDGSETDIRPDGSCPAGQTSCSGVCIDTDSDHENCGGCGSACEAVEVCNEGECVLECPPTKTNCDGSCVLTEEDVTNCGTCGIVCPSGLNAEPVCRSGGCTTRCLAGWSDMDGNGSCETNCVPDPGGETCNGLDDDCDGVKDEDFACQSGQSATQICGSCGTQTRTCSASCTWNTWGTCTGSGSCTPGQVRTQSCGWCGTQTSVCDGSCSWGSWGSCVGEGDCSPGATGSQSCGSCGTQTRTCQSTCSWGSWGTCTGCCGEGHTCSTTSECCSPLQCVSGTCSVQCSDLGESCSTSADCCGAYSCASWNQCCGYDGTSCTSALQCCGSLWCISGSCHPCHNLGESCSTSTDCCGAYSCASWGQCCGWDGTSCTSHLQCCGSLLCTSNVCQAS